MCTSWILICSGNQPRCSSCWLRRWRRDWHEVLGMMSDIAYYWVMSDAQILLGIQCSFFFDKHWNCAHNTSTDCPELLGRGLGRKRLLPHSSWYWWAWYWGGGGGKIYRCTLFDVFHGFGQCLIIDNRLKSITHWFFSPQPPTLSQLSKPSEMQVYSAILSNI